MPSWASWSFFAAWIVALALTGAPASGEVFLVDLASEEPDFMPGDGLCLTAGGFCTLRAAIEESNSNVFSEDIIRFVFPGPTLIVSSNALPTIAGRLTIDGPGAGELTLNAGGNASALTVNPGGGTERGVTIRGLTVEGATAGGFSFAGSSLVARLTDCVATANQGGGIVVSTDATVTVERCEIVENTSVTNGGGMRLQSGVDVTVRDSTIAGNVSDQNGGGVSVFGSSLTDPITKLRLENVTVTGNQASRAGGIVLLNAAQGPEATIVASTIARNMGTAISSGIEAFAGSTLRIGNTILADNDSALDRDCLGGGATIVSLGGNVVGANDPDSILRCAFADGVGGDQVGTPAAPIDPLLGMLADNGGPTPTLLPLAGSPAIDRGLVGDLCLTFDQRGTPRPLDGDGLAGAECDVGTVELDALSVVIFADRFESGSTGAWSATVP